MPYLRSYTESVTDNGVLDNFEKLSKATQGDVLLQVTFQALAPVKESALSYVPRRTGNLANHIEIEYGTEATGLVDETHGHSLCGVSVTEVPYAEPVEMGTSKRAPHAFLRPAWDENIENIQEALLRELRKAIQDEINISIGSL